MCAPEHSALDIRQGDGAVPRGLEQQTLEPLASHAPAELVEHLVWDAPRFASGGREPVGGDPPCCSLDVTLDVTWHRTLHAIARRSPALRALPRRGERGSTAPG